MHVADGHESFTNLSLNPLLDPNDTTTRTSQRPCKLGVWCSAGVASPCALNSYANASVPLEQRKSQGEACIPCHDNSHTTATAATSVAQCQCNAGFYRSTPATATCDQCPLGAECAGGTLVATLRLKDGYWRISLNTSDVRPCPISGSVPLCRGDTAGKLGDYCDSDTTGIDPGVPYCSHCLAYPSEYLNLDTASCSSCSRSHLVMLGYLLGGLFLLALVGVLGRCVPGRIELLKRLATLVAQRASPSAKIKQMLGFYQIVTHLHPVFGVVLPPNFERVQRRFDLLNLNIFALPGLHSQCFGLPTFVSQLLFLSLAPLVLILGSTGFYSFRGEREKALPVAFWLTFLVFSLVSSPAFQSFNCETFNDGVTSTSYLRADYALTCAVDGVDDGGYTTLKVLAVLVILVYPVGVPAVYALLLFGSHRTFLAAHLSFLTSNYRAPFFYWELVETTKKLLLASFFAVRQSVALLMHIVPAPHRTTLEKLAHRGRRRPQPEPPTPHSHKHLLPPPA